MRLDPRLRLVSRLPDPRLRLVSRLSVKSFVKSVVKSPVAKLLVAKIELN